MYSVVLVSGVLWLVILKPKFITLCLLKKLKPNAEIHHTVIICEIDCTIGIMIVPYFFFFFF